jgi:PIN domain nuclease of toxin-antitoxin system
MRLLLDTHVLLWARAAPARLSKAARAALTDPRHQLLVSAVSAWEIAIKHALGRLTLARAPDVIVPELLAATQAETLPVGLEHALRVARLPPHHADPFDRMLVAQAQVEHLTILTADARFSVYDVPVLKA